MGRILGLDYGSKTIGVAVTDALCITVQNVETIVRTEEKKLRKSLARIDELVRELDISEIVLGLPLNMDGSRGIRAEKTLAFKEKLEARTKIPVILQNEQLTTVEADEILEQSGIPKDKRKDVIDQIAANFILQDYLRNVKHIY